MSVTAPGRARLASPVGRRNLAIDLAVALAAFALSLAFLSTGGGASRGLDPLGVLLAALSSLPLVFRRRSPLGVLALTTAASATLNGLDYALGPPVGPTVALFFVAADERTRSRIRETAVVVIGLFAVHIGATAVAHDGFPVVPLLFGIVVWGGAFVAGDQVRQRRQRRAELEERVRGAEREAERERRLAAAEERTRLARDLHDSAGHAINVILVQAGAARLLQERDPKAVRSALQTIEQVARETIGEIDQLVRTLREEETSARVAETIDPPAGLAALETIAARHRAAGLAVTVNVHGSSHLPPAVDQAAYRILQETLTNAARHGLGEADVDVVFDERAVEITVSNTTRPQALAGNGNGHGILGMRERAALLGGTVETDDRDGVFRVRARLPYAGGADR
jgi:signal transduction histidine kinase